MSYLIQWRSKIHLIYYLSCRVSFLRDVCNTYFFSSPICWRFSKLLHCVHSIKLLWSKSKSFYSVSVYHDYDLYLIYWDSYAIHLLNNFLFQLLKRASYSKWWIWWCTSLLLCDVIGHDKNIINKTSILSIVFYTLISRNCWRWSLAVVSCGYSYQATPSWHLLSWMF